MPGVTSACSPLSGDRWFVHRVVTVGSRTLCNIPCLECCKYEYSVFWMSIFFPAACVSVTWWCNAYVVGLAMEKSCSYVMTVFSWMYEGRILKNSNQNKMILLQLLVLLLLIIIVIIIIIQITQQNWHKLTNKAEIKKIKTLQQCAVIFCYVTNVSQI